MTDEQIWMGYLQGAQAAKASVVSLAPVGGILGRSITVFAHALVRFWLKHKATLVPFLTSLAIAALDALVAQLTAIDGVNIPGPQ